LVRISCKNRIGIDDLRAAIEGEVLKNSIHGASIDFTVNDRQASIIGKAIEAIELGYQEMRNFEHLDIIAQSLRKGLSKLGELVGKTTTEDLLSSIFSNFCIGK
jgi:tRNA modification GTPase